MIFKELFSTAVGHASRRGVLEFTQNLMPEVTADDLGHRNADARKLLPGLRTECRLQGMKIHVLMENTACSTEFAAEHGLSLLIESKGRRILFDMGASSAFAENARRMGLDLSMVDAAVLSHGHYDHGGGISRFLELNSHAPVWVSPYAFEPHFNVAGKDIGLDSALQSHTRICSAPAAVWTLFPGGTLYAASAVSTPYGTDSSGMTVLRSGGKVSEDFRHEQYLLLEEQGKRVLFSGCSHRGILNIASFFRPDVLVGGFHFMNLSPDTHAERLNQAADILLQLPTQYLTGHCTGETATAFMQVRMKDRLHSFSAGQTICL